MIQSVLQYCIHVWGSAQDTFIKKIDSVHKAIIKIRFSLPRRFPTNNLYNTTKTFSVKQLFFKSLLLFYHKHSKSIQFHRTKHPHATRYQLGDNVTNPRPRIQLSTRNPHYVLSNIYQHLNIPLKNPQQYTRLIYKKHIFSFLILHGSQQIERFLISQYV